MRMWRPMEAWNEMIRNLSAGLGTRLWLVALFVAVGAFVVTPAPVPAREVTNALPMNHVCIGDFPGYCEFTWMPVFCIEADPPWFPCTVIW